MKTARQAGKDGEKRSQEDGEARMARRGMANCRSRLTNKESKHAAESLGEPNHWSRQGLAM